jgi:hypothetical protein
VVALALAIEFPLHAMTMVPPGTVTTILLVEGLGVADDVEVVGAVVIEPVRLVDGAGDPDGDPEGEGDGEGEAVGTCPPTAFPSRQL